MDPARNVLSMSITTNRIHLSPEVHKIIERATAHEAVLFVAVFLLIAGSGKLGQYLFFEWHTSPAILWPPSGIALAVLYLYGYRMWVPILLGLILISITGPASHLIPGVITTPIGQVIGSMVGAWALHYFKFDASFSNIRNVLMFMVVIIVSSAIAPTITTLISTITGNLSTTALISWSRSWAGFIFSCLIISPLLFSWIRPDNRIVHRHVLELLFVVALVFGATYLLFWTKIASNYSFILLFFFLIGHFWICLRFSTRAITLLIFTTTVFAMLGIFVAPNPERELNQQLFATELFLFLVIPIFYAFTALVKERSNTIDELREAMDSIAKENDAKSEFIAVLAHELRNPLAPVKTTLEILDLMDLEPDIKKLIVSAHQQVHTMRRLLDDLLDVTRVSQGKFQLRIQRTNLCAVINKSIEQVESTFSERKHHISIGGMCDDSIWINVDPLRFEQILVNLLNNAAKYTPENGTITVTYTVTDAQLELRVRDNGLGISAEHLEHIFEPFWQIKSKDAPPSSGIGIGLALTKRIIGLHGGTVHAESEGLGKGSIFIVSFPSTILSEPVEIRTNTEAPILLPQYKILVVDDNKVAADALSKLLSIKGHTVSTVYTGNAALSAVPSLDPDIVLLDIGLPDINGYEVAEKLREGGFTKQIVAVSGYGQNDDKKRAMSSGFNHHLTKPMGIAAFDEYARTISNSRM